MRRYFFKNPEWFSWIYKSAVWKIESSEKVIFLTFDDGPTSGVTEWVIQLLSEYKARATFFCLGKNAQRHPEVLSKLQNHHHVIGNHTFSHIDGRTCSDLVYMREVEKAQEVIKPYNQRKLFRPPYGKIRLSQLYKLKKLGYQIVMWSHLAGDFDQNLDIRLSLRALKKAHSGSVLVFHDSQKAFENLQQILPLVLEHFSTLGFQFKTLTDDQIS